jgi:hypothetical protein
MAVANVITLGIQNYLQADEGLRDKDQTALLNILRPERRLIHFRRPWKLS